MKTYKNWHDYKRGLETALDSVWHLQVVVAYNALSNAKQSGRTIFVAGNGGSAAVANHLACDMGKGAGLRIVSLSSNVPLLTAYSNDTGYENSVSGQLATLVKPGDIVVLISSSGNSPNILKAAKTASDREALVIGLTGFDGGSLSRNCDISIHVDSDNYGCIEDTHSAIMHCLSQMLTEES